jgi:dihydrofolate reductase
VRKIINSTYITIDAAVEDPHLWPAAGDSRGRSDAIQTELSEACDAVLMGRRTYESFAVVWPTRSGDRSSDRVNTMPKYVVSTTLPNGIAILRYGVLRSASRPQAGPVAAR